MTGDVLVLRALGIGDLLVAVPALRGLRRAFPDRRIALAAPAWLADLVPLTGSVGRLVPTPRLGSLTWSDPGPSVAVNLHGAGPESTADLAATGPGRLLAHRHDAFPWLDGPEWHEDTHERVRWCRLLEWYGIPADPADLALERPAVASVAPGAVVVHPGASVPPRRWPADRFAEVAAKLAAAGHRVVVTGSGEERELASAVAAGAGLPDGAVLAGRLGLAELAALVADAALVVSGDTGAGHLATAYGTPSVLLFGPTPPDRWGPPDGPHAVLWAGVLGDPFGDTVHEGLLALTPADALAAAGRVTRG
ncbi:glycosyltransferase family 9 protein [Actinophytocola gossypii]|uniref:Glycosyltransferase family 9 protein n=1 Tax=Actinophytocola gossypii TaxID=2812003 RepID=A0ABT2J6K6_9PSEU|nr:glycosyltransferase family 9 protein [Actinophytocola gossypii]MCT2583493.1 glycosyltransferase family 9 protein [Actinophytocola gossypii]